MARRYTKAACCFGLLLLGACAQPTAGPIAANGPDQQVTQQVFGGTENFDLAMNTPAVQACRLKIDNEAPPDVDGRRYREEPRIAVAPEQVARLRTILANPRTYAFDSAKGCEPTYGVRFLFGAEPEELAVNLCFDCDILTVSRQGESVGGEDFDNARNQLVTLCKELFPDDSEIQGLKAKD